MNYLVRKLCVSVLLSIGLLNSAHAGYVGGNPISSTDPLGLMGNCGTPNGPCIPAQYGPLTATITLNGVCRPGDDICAIAMTKAGIPGNYYGKTMTLNLECIMRVGLTGYPRTQTAQVSLNGISNFASTNASSGVAAFAKGVPNLLFSPVVKIPAGLFVLNSAIDECEIKKPKPLCENP